MSVGVMVLGKPGVRDGEGRVWEEAPGPQGSHGIISGIVLRTPQSLMVLQLL